MYGCIINLIILFFNSFFVPFSINDCDRTWWESILDVVNLFNKQLYDSMYDFIIDSVTTVARDARKERDEIKELKNQPNDVQADRAFESLQEI